MVGGEGGFLKAKIVENLSVTYKKSYIGQAVSKIFRRQTNKRTDRFPVTLILFYAFS